MPRRVLHIEYASRIAFDDGVELAVTRHARGAGLARAPGPFLDYTRPLDAFGSEESP
jgi:hypothetical protein